MLLVEGQRSKDVAIWPGGGVSSTATPAHARQRELSHVDDGSILD